MSGAALTAAVRRSAAWAWSIALGMIAFDFLSLPVFQWRASASYLFFTLAALLVAWAEKREFGTRVFLYRLHDSVIYSPWRFLLLYFLWISVFSPFTSFPLASLVYAANGWLSLFAVGISAQFIFCERTSRGVALLPARLGLAFYFYCGTVLLLMLSSLVLLFLPELAPPFVSQRQLGLFLYFSLGLPFLLWDFIKDGRRLLPRWLSLLTIWTGAVVLLLIGRRFYLASLLLSLAGVLGLFLYKRLSFRRYALVAALAGAVVVGAAALSGALQTEPLLASALDTARRAVEERMELRFAPAWESLVVSDYLGRGVGVTGLMGVWSSVLAEAGVVGFLLYAGFFVSLLRQLYHVRRSARVVVSNVALLSVFIFLLLLSHQVENPYGAYVIVWYSLWALFASTANKKKVA